jgi:hypothetical protein
MHTLRIDRTFAYGDVKIFVAHDAQQRCFAGVGLAMGARGNVVFIEVRPQTLDDLEAGRLDLATLIAHRGIGLIFEVPHQVVRQLHVQASHGQPSPTVLTSRPPRLAPTAPVPLTA